MRGSAHNCFGFSLTALIFSRSKQLLSESSDKPSEPRTKFESVMFRDYVRIVEYLVVKEPNASFHKFVKSKQS